jgi:hypothetical protein
MSTNTESPNNTDKEKSKKRRAAEGAKDELSKRATETTERRIGATPSCSSEIKS